jgi:large subunit ribosomal protein L22
MAGYSFSGYEKEKHARASARDVSISTKDAIEIAAFLRKKPLAKAKATLERVLAFEQAIPYKRFTNGIGHRKGQIGAGRYPQKAAKAFLEVLKSVESNAQDKGLDTQKLNIIHINAHQASRPVHYGRHSGREMKRTHIEVVVGEAQ